MLRTDEAVLVLTARWHRHRTLLLYALIGGSALGLELLLFYLFTNVIHQNIPLSNAMAMGVGFFMSFTLNSFYNFRVRDKLLTRLIRFGVITFGGYWLSTFIILALVDYGHLPALSAKALSLPAFFVFQYMLNKRYSFHKLPAEEPSGQ
jgi:putative flippase GtrA